MFNKVEKHHIFSIDHVYGDTVYLTKHTHFAENNTWKK